MKHIYTILLLSIVITQGCNPYKSDSRKNESILVTEQNDPLIIVDINKEYPQKTFILQDLMDVEYVVLESTDEFLCQGIILAIGEKYIIARNAINDGDIFIFDRKGKGIKKINRKGQGGEEYLFNLSILLDENKRELYVDEVIRDVVVYDMQGHFLRRIPRAEAKWINASNFDSTYLIARESPSVQINKKATNQRFFILSKQNGDIFKQFQINFKEKIEWGVTNHYENSGIAPRLFPIVPYHNSKLLVEPSSDTIFKLSHNYQLSPFIVRKPSIISMKPSIFLLPNIFTENYYFMETIKMEANLRTNEGFPKKSLVYDKNNHQIYEYTMFNNDFIPERKINFTIQEATNEEIAFYQKLEAYELIEAYKKGELKGELKEIAANLKEDSNPVIMVAKYKK